MADMGNRDYEEYRNRSYDLRQERRNAKKKARRRSIIGTLFIVAVVAAGFATKNLWMPKAAEFFESSKETIINDGTPENGNGYPIELTQSEYRYITSVDGMATVISDTYITMYNSKGGEYKKLQHTFVNPVYYTMDDKLFVYDLDGYGFGVYDKKGEIYSKKTEDAIIVASCSESGMAAVVTQTDKYSSFLTVYDENGDAVFKWSGSQRIVSVSFNKDETGCIISTFSASGGKIVSKLFGLEFDKTEEIFETADLDCLVYKSGYCDNGDMWLVGDSVLYRVASDGSVIYTYRYDRELAAFDIGGEIAAWVCGGVSGDYSEIRIFGKTSGPAVFKTDSEIEKIEVLDSQAVYLTDNSFAVLNSSGKVIASAEIEKEYTDFILMEDEAFFIGYDKVDKIDFKK